MNTFLVTPALTFTEKGSLEDMELEVPPLDVPTLEEMFNVIQFCKENNSITKKYLTRYIVEKYRDVRTSKGASLAMCIQTNFANPKAILCRSADIECYDVFSEFFDAIIKDYHKITTDKIHHPRSHFGLAKNIGWNELDPTGRHIISTRIRVCRNVEGFSFPPLISMEERLELERQIVTSFNSFSGELAGNYQSLAFMNKYTFDKLVLDHFLFRDNNSVLRDAGGYRQWPSGRGIYLNYQNNFFIWVNEEDHLRIISMEHGGDLDSIYNRLIKGIKVLEEKLIFSMHSKYGFLTFCPSNLGTTMRASVLVKIPLVSKLPNFRQICEKYYLEARGTYGEHTSNISGIFDLSNVRKLGLTELEAVSEMANGVKEIVSLEIKMEEFNVNILKGLLAVEPLEHMYNLLSISVNKSLTKKYLSTEMVKKYANVRTCKGSTLAQCVRNCAYNPRALCPRSGDAECYDVFKEYFNRIIMDYHGVLDSDFHHPRVHFGDIHQLPFSDLDSTGDYVISTRIRVARSVKGFNFPPTIDKAQRLRLENVISEVLVSLKGSLAGEYYPLTGMNEETQRQLIDDHFLFKDDDPVLRDAGGYRHWPSGRGIFHNFDKTFLVWVCEEDHIRIISMQMNGNIAQVYQRLVEGVRAIECQIPFVYSSKYGFLTCCPSNLGTTMRASVHLRIPKLSSNKVIFDEVCTKYNLQARGFHGEHTESVGGIYDISNRRRLGLTELEAATEMATGVRAIINLEKSL